jgi:hypothetical protein
MSFDSYRTIIEFRRVIGRTLHLAASMAASLARTLATAFSLALLFSSNPVWAQTTEVEEFARAVQSYKTGKTEEAKSAFLALERAMPGNPAAILNLGLIAMKERRPGAALGLWRKGLTEHPTHTELNNAVQWGRTRLQKTDLAHDFSAWESYRSKVLLQISPSAVITASATFLFLAGWLWLRWWGRRRRAYEEDAAGPTTPLAAIFITAFFAFLFTVLITLFLDRLDVRATVLKPKVAVLSAPDPEATVLFEVFEGLEVLVRDVRLVGNGKWRRITFPGGLTGWVRDDDVFSTVDPSERAFEKSTEKVSP